MTTGRKVVIDAAARQQIDRVIAEAMSVGASPLVPIAIVDMGKWTALVGADGRVEMAGQPGLDVSSDKAVEALWIVVTAQHNALCPTGMGTMTLGQLAAPVESKQPKTSLVCRSCGVETPEEQLTKCESVEDFHEAERKCEAWALANGWKFFGDRLHCSECVKEAEAKKTI